MGQPTLFLTVGLPCTGKTTAARRIEVEQEALRLTKDEWVKALYGHENPPFASDVIEGRLLEIGLRALELGTNVVIDYGLWSRDERSALRQAAADLGATVEIRYFDVTPAEQRIRLDQRQAEAPHTTWPMSDEELAGWAATIDIPTPGELDGSEPLDDPPAGFATWEEWRRHRWPPEVHARHDRVRRMSDDPAERPAGPESGLTDDDFSPTWVDDDRPRIPRVAAEREALAAYLEYYRATVEMKCRGLTAEQARTRSVPPSTLSLHGVVRHLAGVERWWLQQNFERRDVPFLFFTADNPDLDFDPPSDADFAADLEVWRAECAVSRQIVAAHDLDDTARPLDWDEDVDLRWVVLRMVTEYAQHCGHIDLLREGIDGRTGA